MENPERCPLCGGSVFVSPILNRCHDCNLAVDLWPRVARLVAIRDAVLKWHEMCELDGPGTWTEIWRHESAIMALAMEADDGDEERE